MPEVLALLGEERDPALPHSFAPGGRVHVSGGNDIMRDVRGILAFVAVVAGSFGSGDRLLAEPQVEVPEGFRSIPWLELDPTAPFERQLGGIAWGPEGERVFYEDGALQVDRDGRVDILATFDPPVYGSCVAVSPDGAVYFAESTMGSVLRVARSGGDLEPVATLLQPYDIAFGPETSPLEMRGGVFVSAPGPSTETNSIWLVRPGAGSPPDEVVSGLPGFSGPIAFDPDGNLYTITASLDPAPELLRFRAETIISGIGEAIAPVEDAEVLAGDLDGAFDLVWNGDRLFATNLGFSHGEGSIDVFDPEEGFAVDTFAAFPFDQGIASPTYLALLDGTGFVAGAGSEGGRLLVHFGDFSTVSRVVEISPELWFVRGEVNGDDAVDLSDVIFTLTYLFARGDRPEPLASADVNASGAVDIADPVYLLGWLFRGGPAPPAPFPERGPAP